VLKAPKIVAMGFSGDPNLPTLRGFVESLAADAAYWSEATSQYGVGPIASGTLTTLDEKAPSTIDDSQIQSGEDKAENYLGVQDQDQGQGQNQGQDQQNNGNN